MFKLTYPSYLQFNIMRTRSDRREQSNSKKKKKRSSYQQKQTTSEIKTLHPKTANQGYLMDSIDDNTVTLCCGAAGVGKTLIALYKGIQMLDKGLVDQILFVRPVVAFRGERGIGFLPGELEEKIAPLMSPILDNLEVFVSKGKADILMKKGAIKFELIEYIRGRSLRDKYIIFDEAQNSTKHSLLTVISRLEESSKLVVLGDRMQSDVLHNGLDGLTDAMMRLERVEDVGMVEFSANDILRASFLKQVIARYQK